MTGQLDPMPRPRRTAAPADRDPTSERSTVRLWSGRTRHYAVKVAEGTPPEEIDRLIDLALAAADRLDARRPSSAVTGDVAPDEREP